VTVYPADVQRTHTSAPGAEPETQHHALELELQLLRSGVLEMAARRAACDECGRALLVGERYHVFDAAGEERRVCALCVANASDGARGPSVRVERVWAAERRLTIRRAA
jgi:hypothetical protein